MPNFRELHKDTDFWWNVSLHRDTGNEGREKGYKMTAVPDDTV